MELKVGICQIKVEKDKQAGLNKAEAMITEAVKAGANLVALPEMFNCPYQNELFAAYAETEKNSPTINRLSDLAQRNNCYLIGGSIPEADGGKIYSSSYVFDRSGRIIAKHRKMHMFDIDVPGEIVFKESAALTPGDQITVFETEYGKMGVAICYDMRFPEVFRLMADRGAKVVFVPMALNMTTGPAHQELLIRCRAVDNQLFAVGISPARDESAAYVAYGHSLAVDPWGDVLGDAGTTESVLVVTLRMDRIQECRKRFPILEHRRKDLYRVVGN